MDHFKAKFLNEAADLIAELEKSVLKLEADTLNPELIEQVFRVMHTFKGNSTMFGYESIGEFTHHLETIYDLVRYGKLQMSRDILDVTLSSVDHIRALLEDENLQGQVNIQNHRILTGRIKNLSGNETPVRIKPDTNTHLSENKKTAATYHIFLKPDEDIFLTGANPLYLIDDLYNLGSCKVYPVVENLPLFNELSVNKSYFAWNILLFTEVKETDIKDVFIFAEDDCIVNINRLTDLDLINHPSFEVFIEPLLNGPSETNIRELSEKAGLLNKAPETEINNTKEKKAPKSVVPSQKETAGSSIRVSSEKLDDLMNLVSELVTTQARLTLYAENNAQSELTAIAENIEKISRQLRDNTFSICLVPIETIFTRFKRLIRDLSAEMGKEVLFITEGSETELDKTIIESLSDPVMHLLRNSMDHGIEDAETRISKGKSRQAKILLKAFYSGTNVHIQVQDDGAGIDPAKIRQKAVQKGIITNDAVLTDKETLDMIFLPGFSTAARVTEVSGRGVGMDVVKRNITDLRGDVYLQSEVGKGTTFTIKLPLTLSVIDGLLVKIGETHFVIPLSVIDKCYEARHELLVNKFNDLIILDSEQVPYFYLREEFAISDNVPPIEQIVVVKYEDKRIGLAVDTVIGEYQAVLKPLGKLYKNLDIISGATILGDGSIALVMDTNQIINRFSNELKNKELKYEY